MSEERPSDGTIRHRRKGPLDTTVSRLQAENERLREALRLICVEGLTVERCFDLASTALSGRGAR